MPKLKYKEIKETENLDARRFYESKFYGLFLNAYKFTNLTKNQTRYILTRLWKAGTVAVFIAEGTKRDPTLNDLLGNKSESTLELGNDNPNGLLIACPYAVNQWNVEDQPSLITLVNTRGATFIPNKIQIVNKDAVIIWAHTSHASVRSLVMYYIDKIVDVENTINMNLYAHKLPRLIICSPEDKERVRDIMEAIDRGEKKLFLDANDYQAIKNVLDSGAGGYIIDKLYQYKQHLENELLSFLGINNVGIEKQERLIVDEANANNQIINDSSDCFLDTIKDCCEEITNILGYPITVKANSSPASNPVNADEYFDEGEQEDENNQE